jgi:hypothetical protein
MHTQAVQVASLGRGIAIVIAIQLAGRWASHAIVKGVLDLSQTTPPSFTSDAGDVQIYNSIDLMFLARGRYMPTSVTKMTRDLSQPLHEDASASDGDKLPPYSM